MSESASHDYSDLPEALMLRVNRLCNDYERAWQKGTRPNLDQLLEDFGGKDRLAAARELIPLEIAYRRQSGETFEITEYAIRFPELGQSFFDELAAIEQHQTILASNSYGSASFQPRPTNAAELKSRVTESGLIDGSTFDQIVRGLTAPAVHEVLAELETQQLLTSFQSQVIANGWSDPLRLGEYVVTERLGAGGMGSVYKATHQRMNRQVALKVLRAELHNNPQQLRRFEREMQAAARLSHPNIVTAYDAGEYNGVHYLITELVEGQTLSRYVHSEGPMPAAKAVDCIRQAAAGLKYAHENGIIHRDIKPSNLLIDQSGAVKILDMGLARLHQEAGPNDVTLTELTHTGFVVGTASYMAPEQARNAKSVDERSDIYSLGCTLYYLLTGEAMFSGDSVLDTLLAHVNEPIPTLTQSASQGGIPKPLDAVFRKMVAKQPADRYASVGDLIEALDGLKIAPVEEAKSPSAGRKGLPVGVLVTVGIAALLITLFTVGKMRQPSEVPEPSIAITEEPGLHFDGRSSYVTVPSLSYNPNVSFTVEIVATVREARHSNAVSWLGQDWFAIYMHQRRWGVCRNDGSTDRLQVSREPARLDVPVHIAGVWDHERQQLRLFIEGQLVEVNESRTALQDRVGGLFIGGVQPDLLPAGNDDRFFNGVIHTVRITSGVVYREEFVPPLYFPEPDPEVIALYRFEEGEGDMLRDSTANGHDGRIVNAQWFP